MSQISSQEDSSELADSHDSEESANFKQKLE